MGFTSINPATGALNQSFAFFSPWKQGSRIRSAEFGFAANQASTVPSRVKRLQNLAGILNQKQHELACLITLEVGKPITQSLEEIKKCEELCLYYAENGADFLKDEIIKTEFTQSLVSYSPLGVVMGIMPWNFPFWQVFRFAIPNLLVGNAVLLRLAPNVPLCGNKLEQIFLEADYPEGSFQNLIIGQFGIRRFIADKRIHAVSVTGSTSSGSWVAELAGKNLKPSVLELDGNDAFIVLQDANIKEAAKMAVRSRMKNTGQSCTAAKRWIVEKSVYDDFIEISRRIINNLKVGDPMDPETEIGPMGRDDFRRTLYAQVRSSIRTGAKLFAGGSKPESAGYYFEPTLLIDVNENCTAFNEELFGPAAAVMPARNFEHAVSLANQSDYGMGASIWTIDTEKAQRMARQLNVGNVFINTAVYNDPRLPFGGVKNSGYGRELGRQGIKAFTNAKTIVIK